MAKRRRSRRRGAWPTLLILLVTSCLVGIALWALWRATLRNQPFVDVAPSTIATPGEGEELHASERERLNQILRRTDEQGKIGNSTK